MKKTKIVILGAGFAGLRVARDLPKRLRGVPHKITLVDRSDVHLYTPDLYEIATAFNPHMNHECLVKLKETVASPLRSLIDRSEVRFIQDDVTAIHPAKKRVELKRVGHIAYDILVVALGSTAAYFNIPGLEEHAYPLKTIRDALAIHSNLDHLFHNLHSEVHIAVGGGGAAGVELVAELKNYLHLLAKKYGYPPSKIRLHLVEGLGELAGVGPRGTRLIMKRLRQRGVQVHLHRFVNRVEKDRLHLKAPGGRKNSIACSFFIWTGGVQVNPVVAKALGSKETRGAIAVEDTMQSKLFPAVFAAGDNVALTDPHTGKPFPLLAQYAYLEGALVAHNIACLLREHPLRRGRFHKPVMVVPLGGRYGVMRVGDLLLKGKRVWLLHRLIALRYAMTILSPWKAFKKWRKDSQIFSENDC